MGLRQHMLLPLLGLAGLVLNGADALVPLRDLCPVTCLDAGPNPSNWTVVAEFSQLQACQRPLVVEFSVTIPMSTKQQIRVCNMVINEFANLTSPDITFASTIETETKQVNPQLAWTPASSEGDIGGRLVIQSVGHLRSYLSNNGKAFKPITLFGTVSGTTAGVYIGANVLGSSVAGDLFDSFLNNLYKTGIADSKASLVQLCEGRSADDIVGLIAASSATFSTVHDAVGRWSNGTCVDTSSYVETRELGATAVAVVKPEVELEPAYSNSTAASGSQKRATYCRTIVVQQYDDCTKLVTRCGGGLTAANFYKYNPKTNLCSTLMPGQYVCCTSGTLMDVPKPNSDGSCAAYQVQPEESCNGIAAAHGLTLTDIYDLNKETWGWSGCGDLLWAYSWICLSEGTPPFPAAIANSVCGPQKPGTTKPSGSTSRDWAKLNPCPLNSCCNIWGQCGTTTDFCIDTNTGPPGTAKKDTYGCISNCGMSIIKSGPPAQFIKLGYFEGFNLGRGCLNMDASQVDPSYTHVHFAFGMISPQFEVYQEDLLTEFQFQQFKTITTARKVISFGGWVFSAEAPNYPIFRNAVSTAANREKLATNLVAYVVNNGLDGLDIDWEYPAAPDLPDIPKGDLSEALNYLRLLATIRAKLPKDKSLSIAAPSSYWYLKQFPIKAMSELLDYIVFMTYDLHGQWDAGNEWANPGCPTGNCLRSHINRTETMSALTMITKAGVPSNKVLVGVSSYGRSFQMVDPSCTGTNCLYTGDRKTSYARPGRCTETSGYLSNAELAEIGGRIWTDVESNSKIMVDGDLWVSYMDDELKASRTLAYQRYDMGGTIDWAVDLTHFHEPPNYGGIEVGPDWTPVKTQIKLGKNVNEIAIDMGCDAARAIRTGNWVPIECTVLEVSEASRFTSDERWETLECENGWTDVLRIYKGCYSDGKRDLSFTGAIAEIIHTASGTTCDDLGEAASCPKAECFAHNKPSDLPSVRTGACTYEIWNSISELHIMIKNFYGSLETAKTNVKGQQDTFILTFAPKPDDGAALLALFLNLIPIPLNMMAGRFIAGEMMTRSFFKNNPGRSEMWQAAVSNIVSSGASIAKDALAKAADGRTEIAFNAIMDTLIGSWQGQVDQLIVRIFDGSEDSINKLTGLFSDGKMITNGATSDGVHTASWNREKNIERAFYAAAIPAAWTANRPAPVVVDFGASCEIDARGYFTEEPDVYNVGWRCPNGHSYILAGVRDGPQDLCGENHSGDGGVCVPVHQWTFDILSGIGKLKDDTNQWGGVTVDDLIIGAVNTYEKNGKKNIMDTTIGAPNTWDKTITEQYEAARVDIRTGGLIRIPVCSAEEAKKNLGKGRAAYGESPNYPCDP